MILYLHGFSSAAASGKAARLQSLLAPLPLMVPDYPSHHPRAAVAQLQAHVERARQQDPQARVELIGSSLGGFYAQYLGATLEVVAKVVMINPALRPWETLSPLVGENTNMLTGKRFLFSRADLEELTQFDVPAAATVAPTLVLLDEADEVLDYRIALQRYRPRGRVVVYPGGSHRFEHIEAAAREIAAFLAT